MLTGVHNTGGHASDDRAWVVWPNVYEHQGFSRFTQKWEQPVVTSLELKVLRFMTNPALSAPKAVSRQNQIAFAAMTSGSYSNTRRRALAAAAVQAPGAPQSVPAEQRANFDGIHVLAYGALAAGVVLALLASQDTKPLLLTALAVLSMFGAFFLFGIAAGHIRLGERVSERELLGALLEGIDDGVLVTDRDGRHLFANRMLGEILATYGAGADHATQSIELTFQDQPAPQEAIYRLMRAASRGETWREEIVVKSAQDDQPRRLRVSHKPFLIPGRERDFGHLVLWNITDVTIEYNQAARQVQSLEAAIAAYDQAPVGLVSVSADGRITQVSAAFARWLGTTGRQIHDRGLTLNDILTTDSLALLRESTQDAGADGTTMDLDVIGEDGRQVTMTMVARRLSNGGLMIAARNQALASQSMMALGTAPDAGLAGFFNAAPFGIATVTRDGRISSANSAFARMILDGSSGLGTPALDILSRTASGTTKSEIAKALDGAMAGKAQPTPIEISIGENQQYARRVYMSPVQTDTESGECAIVYVLDATEQKALEAKFAQSSKMEAVGKLAGGIAHDFNNVLTAIIGFSDLLLQTHRPTDPAYKDIANIRSSANRAAGLVAQLLAFSRRQTLQPEPLQLGEVVSDWVNLMKRTIGEQVDMKVKTGRDLWFVKTDKTQYEQVITNLVVNAKDAMPNGGTLTIHTRNVSERDVQKQAQNAAIPVGEYVLTEVSDTGCGMDPDVLAKIFEPFFTTKEVGKGTGLGLATCYGIVKQSGGFIFPESTPGEGTTFRVYLPRYIPNADDKEASDRKAGKKDRARDLTGTGKVLLVEDEDVVRSFAARALKRQGYDVLEADSGIAALEVMEECEGQVDIVVSDVVMPEMDGPTLLKELRKQNPDLKIIFVSGYPNEAFEASLGPDQQFAFLPKPFSLPQLAAKVKEELAK